MNTEIKKATEVFEIRNEKIEVESDFRFDVESNTKISDNYLDDIAINKAFSIYREKFEIMGKDEIRKVRNKYGLSQRAFATLTGIGVATIARYETGQIPTNANNELLKSIRDDFRTVEKLFNRNKDNLKPKDQQKFQNKINEIANKNSTNEVLKFVQKRIESNGPSIYTGYKTFDFEKFKQLVLYFSGKINYLSKIKLNKLLFYADFKFFEEEILSITGLSYVHDYYGPAPTDFEILYATLYDSEAIMWKIFTGGKGEYIKNVEPFDPSVFTNEELEIMEQVVATFKKDNAEIISEKSYEEYPYKTTEMKELISYDDTGLLKHL